jgi:hypothetical protein
VAGRQKEKLGLVAAILLLALAHIAKAACDNLTHQAGNSVFEQLGPWFDARTSWKNKYATGSWEAGAPRPRFWLSTTALVFVTDFWHTADAVYLTAYAAGAGLLGIVLATTEPVYWLLALGAVKGAGGGVFQVFYYLFRIKK